MSAFPSYTESTKFNVRKTVPEKSNPKSYSIIIADSFSEFSLPSPIPFPSHRDVCLSTRIPAVYIP